MTREMKTRQTATGSTELDFSSDTDADLLLYMSWQDDDEEAPRAAWAEFFVRHRAYLLKQVRRHRLDRLVGLDAPDIVAEVSRRIFQRSATFDADGVTGAALGYRIKAWMNRITENLIRDLLRQAPPEDLGIERLARIPVLEYLATELEQDALVSGGGAHGTSVRR